MPRLQQSKFGVITKIYNKCCLLAQQTIPKFLFLLLYCFDFAPPPSKFLLLYCRQLQKGEVTTTPNLLHGYPPAIKPLSLRLVWSSPFPRSCNDSQSETSGRIDERSIAPKKSTGRCVELQLHEVGPTEGKIR